MRAIEAAAKAKGGKGVTGADVRDALLSQSFPSESFFGVLPAMKFSTDAPFPTKATASTSARSRSGKYKLTAGERARARRQQVVKPQAWAGRTGPGRHRLERGVLELNNVEVLYSDVILAVKGISAKVPDASCVTLLGANGAGKSTTLKAISNLIKTEDGARLGRAHRLRRPGHHRPRTERRSCARASCM